MHGLLGMVLAPGMNDVELHGKAISSCSLTAGAVMSQPKCCSKSTQQAPTPDLYVAPTLPWGQGVHSVRCMDRPLKPFVHTAGLLSYSLNPTCPVSWTQISIPGGCQHSGWQAIPLGPLAHFSHLLLPLELPTVVVLGLRESADG